MTTNTRAFTVAGAQDRPVRCVAHGRNEDPTVLIAHGFKGFKDWGFFPWLAEALATEGLQAIRFDFSHNGVAERDFDRLDLFMVDTPSHHQVDLAAVAATTTGPLGVIGHSRGGGDALLFAASEPRVAAVATLASVSTIAFPIPDADEVLRERGYYPIANARTKQEMPLSVLTIEDARRHDLEAAVRALTIPVLAFHGTKDTSVAPSALGEITSWAQDARGVSLDGSGHTFEAVHPFQGPTPALEAIVAESAAFFRGALG